MTCRVLEDRKNPDKDHWPNSLLVFDYSLLNYNHVELKCKSVSGLFSSVWKYCINVLLYLYGNNYAEACSIFKEKICLFPPMFLVIYGNSL